MFIANTLTEKDIIEGCQAGKTQCQKELVVRYSPMLLSVCRRYTRDEASAKDILQETLIKIFRYIHKYRPIGSFQGWIRRIAVTSALQAMEKSSYKNEKAGLDKVSGFSSDEPDAYSHLGAEELMAIIACLPEGFKQVFNLYVVDGYSHREIGEMLGISESTSRSQLTRAKKQLRRLIVQREKIRV